MQRPDVSSDAQTVIPPAESIQGIITADRKILMARHAIFRFFPLFFDITNAKTDFINKQSSSIFLSSFMIANFQRKARFLAGTSIFLQITILYNGHKVPIPGVKLITCHNTSSDFPMQIYMPHVLLILRHISPLSFSNTFIGLSLFSRFANSYILACIF